MNHSQIINGRCHYAMEEELAYLRDVAGRLSPGAQVVMIGAGPGVMAVAMMESNPALSMTVIDITTTQFVELHLREAGITENVRFLTLDSRKAGRNWTMPLDFLIVDGDHSYAGVKADLELWLPHLRPGASVFLHDCYDRGELLPQPEVMLAVSEVMAAWGEPLQVGTAAVFTRRER